MWLQFSRYAKTLVVAGFPGGQTNRTIFKWFQKFGAISAEVVKNANGKARPLAVVEFKSARECEIACRSFSHPTFPSIYMKPLYLMTFPGLIHDCCSIAGFHPSPFLSKYIQIIKKKEKKRKRKRKKKIEN